MDERAFFKGCKLKARTTRLHVSISIVTGRLPIDNFLLISSLQAVTWIDQFQDSFPLLALARAISLSRRRGLF